MGLMPQQRNLLKSNTIKLFPKINFILGNNAVESEGIEPSSKQVIQLLSTSLVLA